MMRSFIITAGIAAQLVAGQSTTSIDIAAIAVPVPTSVFVLPVVYVTKEGGPVATATTLAMTEKPSSDAKATNVFDSQADALSAISSASQIAAATPIAVAKRDVTACVAQPLGISYGSTPDTAAAFEVDNYYPAQALAATTPSGYVQAFSNLNASNSADNYMGYTLLPSYDVAGCAAKCSAVTGCNSFNVYFERDPTLDPNSKGCPNPPSTVNIKCVFWGGVIGAANANNFGQWRSNFQVLISGSNGYMGSIFAANMAKKYAATSTSTAASLATNTASNNVYTIYYSSDSNQGAYSNAQASSSYKDCMTACDAELQCQAFSYVGGADGVGSGTCWLKTGLGSPTSANSNYVSGVRSGKGTVSSVTSSSTLTSSTSSKAQTSVAASTTSAASTSSASTSSASTSSASTSSASTSSAASSTTLMTSTSTTLITTAKPTTTSISSTTTSSSTTTTSSKSTLSTPFYINIGNSNTWQDGKFAHVSTGTGAKVDWVSTQTSATKFQLDSKTGYLVEYTGSSGFAANIGSASASDSKVVVWSPQAQSNTNYITCSQNTGAGWLECQANGAAEQAYICDGDFLSTLWFGQNIPWGCHWVGMYYTSTSY